MLPEVSRMNRTFGFWSAPGSGVRSSSSVSSASAGAPASRAKPLQVRHHPGLQTLFPFKIKESHTQEDHDEALEKRQEDPEYAQENEQPASDVAQDFDHQRSFGMDGCSDIFLSWC